MGRPRKETTVQKIDEQPAVVIDEVIEAAPSETPVCGIGGCLTWYDDPAIMRKHKIRQHGIGIESLNKPLPRHADVTLK